MKTPTIITRNLNKTIAVKTAVRAIDTLMEQTEGISGKELQL